MASVLSEQPRKSLIMPKRKAAPTVPFHDSRDQKRLKVDESTTTLVKNNVVVGVKKMDNWKKIMKERNDGKDSRTRRTSSSPQQSSMRVDSRKNDVKEEKMMMMMMMMMMMDQCKKNQCWVIVKRMIVGKDGWALKKSLDLKVLNNYEQIKEEFKVTAMRTIGLEDIEAKLNKLLYSMPDEFADDMKLVFCRAFLFPPKSQVHRIARRFSESFENNWKSLKEKWTLEDRKRKRVHK